MKKMRFCTLLMFVLFILTGISCSSAPQPAADTAVVPDERPPAAATDGPGASGPGQAALDTLNAALAKANEARKQAADFDSPGYFPGDWEAAEAQYAAAGRMSKSTDSEAQQAAAAYNALADTYDGILNRTIPLYAQAREDEIMAARDDVIATGLGIAFPDFLSPADHTAVRALEQYEEKDYYAAKDSAADALLMYETLHTGAGCWFVWQEITERGFGPYDHDNFDEADELIDTALEQYMAGDIARAHDNAAEALRKYNEVLHTGWLGYTSRRAASAEAERQAALDMKANIAVRDMFHEADVVYHEAADVLKAGDYEEAVGLYTDAEALFIMASMATSEKRRIAAETIREADDLIEHVTETARQVDLEIEGGSR